MDLGSNAFASITKFSGMENEDFNTGIFKEAFLIKFPRWVNLFGKWKSYSTPCVKPVLWGALITDTFFPARQFHTQTC